MSSPLAGSILPPASLVTVAVDAEEMSQSTSSRTRGRSETPGLRRPRSGSPASAPPATGSKNIPRTVIDIDNIPANPSFSSLKSLEETVPDIGQNARNYSQVAQSAEDLPLRMATIFMEHIIQLQASMAAMEQRLLSTEHLAQRSSSTESDIEVQHSPISYGDIANLFEEQNDHMVRLFREQERAFTEKMWACTADPNEISVNMEVGGPAESEELLAKELEKQLAMGVGLVREPSEESDGPSPNARDARTHMAESADLVHVDGTCGEETAPLHPARAAKGGASWHAKSVSKRMGLKSKWVQLFTAAGILHLFPAQPPHTKLSKMVLSPVFGSVCIVMTILNGAYMGYEADFTMKAVLRDPPTMENGHLVGFDIVFAVFFSVELFLRILAGRGWFFVSPTEWAWHWMDILCVLTGFLSDFNIGDNLSFFRLVRVVRLIRIAKVIRGSGNLRHLRQMLLSIMASLISLAWALLFLGLIIFLFSIFFLNAAAEHVKNNNYDNSVRQPFHKWYSTLLQTMFGLAVAISGGTDWIDIMEPIKNISWTYQIVFTFYVFFVVIGVVNVMTGVFLASAAEVRDRDIIVQDEIGRLDSFVQDMLDLYTEFNPHHDGSVTWDHFQVYIHQEHVEAFLSYHLLETTHASLLFKMLDHNQNHVISLHEFVIGMLKLRGVSTTYDARLILREVTFLRKSMDALRQQVSKRSRKHYKDKGSTSLKN